MTDLNIADKDLGPAFVFTSPEVVVLRCLKHNLLSSQKIIIFNSFIMIY